MILKCAESGICRIGTFQKSLQARSQDKRSLRLGATAIQWSPWNTEQAQQEQAPDAFPEGSRLLPQPAGPKTQEIASLPGSRICSWSHHWSLSFGSVRPPSGRMGGFARLPAFIMGVTIRIPGV